MSSEIAEIFYSKDRKPFFNKADNICNEIKPQVNKPCDILTKNEGKEKAIIPSASRIEFCKTFDSKQGCSVKYCPKLHVCRHFVKGKCTFGLKCKKPHHFEDAHTQKILQEHQLNCFTHARLKEFLCRNVQYSLEDMVNQASLPKQLEICKYYNVAIGCSRDELCPFLHVCRFYAEEGSCKFGHKCIRRHDVQSDHARDLLSRYAVQKKDVFAYLRKKPESKESNVGENCLHTITLNSKMAQQEVTTRSQSIYITDMKKSLKPRTQSCNGSDSISVTEPVVRKFSDSILGKVEMSKKNEICHAALHDRCIGSMYCLKLHTQMPFCWQFSLNGSDWKMIQPQDNVKLETKYADVSQNESVVTIGGCEFRVTFSQGIAVQKNYSYSCYEGNSAPLIIHIRRLSTQSTVGNMDKNSNFLTTWIWYYLDDRNNWQSYDDDPSISPSKRAHLLNSAAIEIAFLDPRRNSFQFKKGSRNFIIDFKNLVEEQVGLKLKKEIRRRPKLFDVLQMQDISRIETTPSEKSYFPSYWKISGELSNPGGGLAEQCELLELEPTSNEYLKVIFDFGRTLSQFNVTQVMAVQNPRLWMTYTMKRDKLAEINSSNAEEKSLYRKAPFEFAEQICRNGFENCRLGLKDMPYFARAAKLANRGNVPNGNGFYVMFLCKVLISTSVTATVDFDETMHNSLSDEDDLSIYYVFEQEKVYPEFIVLFKD